MVGHWYSEYIDPDTREQVRSIAERRADGVLVLRFRKYRDGRVVSEHEEAGRWFVSDGLYKNHIKVVDGLVMENFITYTILSRSDNEVTYKHEPTGLTFNGKRVEASHKLP